MWRLPLPPGHLLLSGPTAGKGSGSSEGWKKRDAGHRSGRLQGEREGLEGWGYEEGWPCSRAEVL